jgi:hypothetical protein
MNYTKMVTIKVHCIEGLFNCVDGPAIILSNGDQVWYFKEKYIA